MELDTECTVDTNGCARCHGDGHKALLFRRMTHPMEVGRIVLTHWAACPINGEPILMGIVPIDLKGVSTVEESSGSDG